MNIGFMGICILVILLCVPVYLIYFYKLNLQRKFALAFIFSKNLSTLLE